MEYQSNVAGEKVALEFYPTAFSPRYVYAGAGPIRIFGRGESAAAFELTPSADLSDIVIIWLQLGAKNQPEHAPDVRVFDDTVLRRPAGSAAILNVSGLSLRGSWEKRAIAVDEGLSALMTRASAGTLELRTLFKDRWFPSYREALEIRSGERGLLILLPPARRGSLEIQSRWLVDRPDSAATPAH